MKFVALASSAFGMYLWLPVHYHNQQIKTFYAQPFFYASQTWDAFFCLGSSFVFCSRGSSAAKSIWKPHGVATRQADSNLGLGGGK
jgi:hypothetical protein